MYAMRALAGAVVLGVLAVPLFLFALTGPWFSLAVDDQLVPYVAGVLSIGCGVGAVAQYREWECRRLHPRSDRP